MRGVAQREVGAETERRQHGVRGVPDEGHPREGSHGGTGLGNPKGITKRE